jgi:uncharacterized damage-inducible protein DinB
MGRHSVPRRSVVPALAALAALAALVAPVALPLAAQQPAAPAAPTGFHADVLADYARITGRLVQLAEAMPADKLGWRPAEGVRSFAEVLMHVAAGNYMGAASLGSPPPAGIDPAALERISDRQQVVDTLRASIAHFQTAAAAVDPQTLGEKVDLFGGSFAKSRVLVMLQGHAHEHTGQAIAYARMNGVVPPWSRGEG